MDQSQNVERLYYCPMHAKIRRPGAAKCPMCGMDLVPEGTRFAMLRHMVQNPVVLVIMATVMLAIMVAVMVLRQ